MSDPLSKPAGMSREQLLALTPRRYLIEGYCDPQGAPRGELEGLWALAAAEQLKAAAASPADFERVVHAVAQAARKLPPSATLKETLDALHTALRAVTAASPSALSAAQAWVGMLRSQAEVPVLLQHMSAVLRMLGLLTGLDEAGAAAARDERPQ